MNSVTIVKGETRTLRYRIEEDGAPRDITGMSFKMAVKERPSDAAPAIGPVEGVIENASGGEFSFTLNAEDTGEAVSGRMEIAMFDSAENKLVLTPAGGVEFRIRDAIVEAPQ